MKASFVPSPQDVDRYRRFRALSVDLHGRVLKTIPRRAYDEIGDALGIRRNGVLVFDTEDMASIMMDCCIYDWHENGRNLIQQYAETHPATPGTDECYLLQACLDAKYRVLVTESAVPGAGLHCRDVLNSEEICLMDIALSRSFRGGELVLATRTISLGDFWMTTGAGLPINSTTDFLGALRDIERGHREMFEGPEVIALSVVRACLKDGAVHQIAYGAPRSAPPASKKLRREPRWPGFKRRRR